MYIPIERQSFSLTIGIAMSKIDLECQQRFNCTFLEFYECFGKEETLSELGLMLGCSAAAISRRLSSHGISHNPTTQCLNCSTTTTNRKYCSTKCSKQFRWPKYKKKHKELKLTRLTKRKSSLIDMLGGKCQHCGLLSDNQSIFCFHHVRDKEFTLDIKGMEKPWSSILDEVKKCQLLCHNCHQILHEQSREDTSVNKSYIAKKNKAFRRKTKLIELSGKCCSKCNFTSDYLSCFSFHHIVPANKVFELSMLNLRSKSDEAILAEWKKCELLCMNCHIGMNPDR